MSEQDADEYGRSAASSDNLRFPILTLENRVHVWLHRLGNDPYHVMPTTIPSSDASQSDDNSSSLGDSAYDLLTESLILTSSDEDHNDAPESVASISEHETGPDDVQSLAGTEDSTGSVFSHEDDELLEDDGRDSQQETPAQSQNISGSAMTISEEAHAASALIEFDEPACVAETVAVSHTIRNFDELETAKVLRPLRSEHPPSRVSVTVRQTMTKAGLVLKEPFRLLYVGNRCARPDITRKIGEALAVRADTQHTFASRRNSNSTRYSVIPVSAFGSGKASEVELIDSQGIDFIVDDCTSARESKMDGEETRYSILLNDDVWYDPQMETTGDFAALPHESWHLAIIYCAESDVLREHRTRHFARLFAMKNAIPFIMVFESAVYGFPYPVDPHAVHVCLETRGPSGGNEVIKRLPIDLTNFLNIDAQQMSRNLAYITGLHVTRERPKPRRRSTPLLPKRQDDLESRLAAARSRMGQSSVLRRGRKGQEWKALFMLGMIFFCAMLAGTVSLVALKERYRPSWSLIDLKRLHFPPKSTAPATKASMGKAPSSLFTGTIAITPTKNLPTRVKLSQTTNAVAVASSQVDLASLLFDPSLTGLNESDKFKMQVVGDCHMILRPPYRYHLKKNPPQLHVKVSRNETPIEVRLSKLFEGVYALQLDREEAYGPLNVSVWTLSKPRMQQSFEIDFGTPWLKVAGWKRALQIVSEQIHKDARVGQQKLATIFNRYQATLEKSLGEAAAQATITNARLKHVVRTEAAKASAHFTSQARRFSDEAATLIAARARYVSSEASKHSAILSETVMARFSIAGTQTVQHYRHLSDRASRTFTAHRAQKQAKLLWIRMRSMELQQRQQILRVWKSKDQRGSCGRTGGCRQRGNR